MILISLNKSSVGGCELVKSHLPPWAGQKSPCRSSQLWCGECLGLIRVIGDGFVHHCHFSDAIHFKSASSYQICVYQLPGNSDPGSQGIFSHTVCSLQSHVSKAYFRTLGTALCLVQSHMPPLPSLSLGAKQSQGILITLFSLLLIVVVKMSGTGICHISCLGRIVTNDLHYDHWDSA